MRRRVGPPDPVTRHRALVVRLGVWRKLGSARSTNQSRRGIDARRILLIPEPSPKSASTNASVWSVEGVSSRPGLIARGVRRRPRGVGAPTPRVPASIQLLDRSRHRGRSRQLLPGDTARPVVDDVAALKHILGRMRSCCLPGLLKYSAIQGNSQIDCVSRPPRRASCRRRYCDEIPNSKLISVFHHRSKEG